MKHKEMTLRNDDRIEINLQGQVEHSQQSDIRSFLLDTWKAESPGTQYRYFVETLQNGKRIYLERPVGSIKDVISLFVWKISCL